MVSGWHGGFSSWLVHWTLNQTIYFVVSVEKTEVRLARLSVLLLVYSCSWFHPLLECSGKSSGFFIS